MSYIKFFSAVCMVALVGCVGTEESKEKNYTAEELATQYTRTIVHLNGDAAADVKTVQFTLADQLAERASLDALEEMINTTDAADTTGNERIASAKAALLQDTSCAFTSMWAFDFINLTGNEICFAGTGSAWLVSYSRGSGGGDWAQSVLSYRSGTLSGAWMDFNPSFPTTIESYASLHTNNDLVTTGKFSKIFRIQQ